MNRLEILDVSPAACSTLQVVASLSTNSGGTSRVVYELVNGLGGRPPSGVCGVVSASVFTYHSPTGTALIPEFVQNFYELSRDSLAERFLGFRFYRSLMDACSPGRYAVLHSHGLWLPVNAWAYRCAQVSSIPLVSSPHGMLEPWALGHHPWRKRIAALLFQRNALNKSRAVVASSEAEYHSIRSFGVGSPVAIIPHGVEASMFQQIKSLDVPGKMRTALFLSRIHPKKGLSRLLKSWAALRPDGWKLVIAGPDEGNHLAELKTQAHILGLGDLVMFVGPLFDQQRMDALNSASLFVLPSHSENFGIVVAEALALGVPVITTTGTPWQELVDWGCGWWVDLSDNSLENALHAATSLPADKLFDMGMRARTFALRFNWYAIAEQYELLYEWVCGKSNMPDFVRLD